MDLSIRTLFDSGESIVDYVCQHTITLDGVFHSVYAEVDELFMRPPHQHVTTVHVTMLKL